MSTCITSIHFTLGRSTYYECARLQYEEELVPTPMFYLMSLGLAWFDLHVLITESRRNIAHAHTLPNIVTFWFHFLLGLPVSVCEQKDRDSIFHWGVCRCCHLYALSHQGRKFCCSKCMWAYARVWSEVCRLKPSVRGRVSSLVRDSSEQNSADVVPLTDNNQRIPSEETAGYELHEKA